MLCKPPRLKAGDTVALVSLSSGLAGEQAFRHRVEVARARLETEFGLHVMLMPNAMRGIAYLSENPQARAADWMAACQNPQVKAVITMIGGDDTIRLLPYIDFDVLSKHPKIFMGYSDTTVNHFMMFKAGVASFYGPCAMVEFAENTAMHSYTKQFIRKVLFEAAAPVDMPPSPGWTSEHLDWADPANNGKARTMIPENRGYELLQGTGTVCGRLLGGCVDVLPMLIGTSIWPTLAQWRGSILFLETSEEHPSPSSVKYLLRGLAAQGVLSVIRGIIVGKPKDEMHYEAYKEVFTQVLGTELGQKELPILYNLNFGHNAPMCIMPYGTLAEINCNAKTFRLLEASVE